MTKDQFEQAVREKCPPEILGGELAGLDQSYQEYLAVDDILGNRAVIGYEVNRETGQMEMTVGTPEAYQSSKPQPPKP
jgi:hypothetical protein